MVDIATILTLFSSFSRAPGAVWTETAKRKAPHKPLLLLAVLDLVYRGVITTPFISVSGDLVELNELFTLYRTTGCSGSCRAGKGVFSRYYSDV